MSLNNKRKLQIVNGKLCYRCTGECGQWLPVEDFRPNKNVKSVCGRASECRSCERLTNRASAKRRRQNPTAYEKRKRQLAANARRRRRERTEREARWREKVRNRVWETVEVPVSKPVVIEMKLPPLRFSLANRCDRAKAA